MSTWFEMEAAKILQDQQLRAEAIQILYDDALHNENLARLYKIRDTYERGFLEHALGGYPDYLEEIERED